MSIVMDKGKDMILFNIFAYLITGLVAIFAIIPFLMLVVGSVQSEDTIMKFGYTIIPRELDFTAYQYIFASPEKILRSYGVTLFITITGTVLSLLFSSMTAYVLSRKDVKYRNPLAFYLFFTTLFNGGLVPYYLLISNYLQLRDTLAILVLSNMFNVIYIFIIRAFIDNSLPDSISESAKIDGANDFVIYWKIVLPLMTPALASIGLFISLGYWNDWFTSTLFILDEKLFPLQYMLYKMLTFATFAQKILSENGAVSAMEVPTETMKLALTVVATGPIILAYPFAQKYFIAGMTIGAVKG
ncbi:MAG: carbohydrate ABC transporter permease [Paenibacillaceae bacterium]